MADPAVVQTDAGPVRGAVTDDHRLFQAIPYAASTAGELRWPQPVQPYGFGAFHAAEAPYLFPDQPFQAGSTPDQRRLSDQVDDAAEHQLDFWSSMP